MAELTGLLRRLALDTLAEVLPGTNVIEAWGELNEDWVPTLRIRRVLGAGGEVLFDVEVGHPDRAVEDAVDAVDIELLDLLIDVTGEEYMGRAAIG